MERSFETTAMRSGNPSPPPSNGSCQMCEHWELRFLVSVRAAYYLTLHLPEPELREAVLGHLTACWTAHIAKKGSAPGTFEDFFTDYCEWVERDADPRLFNTGAHAAEYNRVWMNHAALLSNRLDLVRPHPVQVAA
jgi:hypothetical protein